MTLCLYSIKEYDVYICVCAIASKCFFTQMLIVSNNTSTNSNINNNKNINNKNSNNKNSNIIRTPSRVPK
jgi:hypothetical protein